MIESYFNSYENWKEDINDKYFPPDQVEELIQQHSYHHEVVGNSEENRPIYLLKMGSGTIKVLCWAQMHGNETTASRAMFDVWKILQSESSFIKNLLNSIQIHFIPQLNPDGAVRYNRLNANNIDLNRDFNACSSKEMNVLRNLVERENYNFLFNLHDQRTIFHPKESDKPATLSFLAPVVDKEGSIPSNRRKAIQVISHIVKVLEQKIPNQIAKFSDEFYPDATGDNFQKLGYPTILIECGHYPNDYERNITRKLTFLSLMLAFVSIASQSYLEDSGEAYEALPENDDKALDIIYRNVQVLCENSKQIVDIGIQYDEVLTKENISHVAKIILVGDLSDFIGHDICHAENRLYQDKFGYMPDIGNLANFELDEWQIVNGKIINN